MEPPNEKKLLTKYNLQHETIIHIKKTVQTKTKTNHKQGQPKQHTNTSQ